MGVRCGQLSCQALSWEKVNLFEKGGVSVCPKESQHTHRDHRTVVSGPACPVCVEVHASVVTARDHAKTAFSFKTPWWGNSTVHLGLVNVEA